jgi:hypothetical protein
LEQVQLAQVLLLAAECDCLNSGINKEGIGELRWQEYLAPILYYPTFLRNRNFISFQQRN